MKIPRFVKEYASYRITNIRLNPEINYGIKCEMIRRLENVINYYELGFITTDETMKTLSGEIGFPGEDFSKYAI